MIFRRVAQATILILSALTACAGEGISAVPLLDLKTAIQFHDDNNLQLDLVCAGIFADSTNLRLSIVDGVWQVGSATVGGFNKAKHPCAIELKASPGKLSGRIQLTLKPDQWVPKDKLERTIPIDLDLALDKSGGDSQSWKVTGTWKATLPAGDSVVEKFGTAGVVSGTTTKPVGGGRFQRGERDQDGIKFTFDLGAKRTNWNRSEFSVNGFAKPLDWSAATGLRLRIRSDQPQASVQVGLWLREADGCWYYQRYVCPLVGSENTGTAWFSDFTVAEYVSPGDFADADFTLDLKRITGLAIGVVNPFGIGKTAFTVTGIDLVTDPAQAIRPAHLTVTGRTLAVNRQEMVPAGIFGGYAPDLPAKFRPGCQRALFTTPEGKPSPAKSGEAFILDAWGERNYTAPILTSPKWKEMLQANTLAYATAAKQNPGRHVLEFWNEPYLNWARGNGGQGSAFTVRHYDVAKAVAGGPVAIKHSGTIVPHFRWVDSGQVSWTDAAGKKGLPKDEVAPEKAKAGDTVDIKGKIYTARTEWRIEDVTKFTYWSGQGIGFLYDNMAEVVAKTAKETNPDLTVVAGWEFRWNEDHWAAWDLLFKPTIDRIGPWIDGVTEHHYQGDTAGMNGIYEVLAAYGLAKHGKWLHSYNTETNDLVDIPAVGPVDTPEKAKAAYQWHIMVYNLRDCLYSVLQSPDKLRSRTVIHSDTTPKATEIAYGLMADLRGRLVATTSDDTKVWSIASIDGTDPKAMPADGAAKLVVFVWNDHRSVQTATVDITAPTGCTFTKAVVETPIVAPDFQLSLKKQDLAASGTTFTHQVTLEPRSVVRLVLPLAGTPPAKAELVRIQHFSKDILQIAKPGTAAATTVAIPAAERASAKRAWLRLVLEDLADGEGSLKFNGTAIRLPRVVTNDNTTAVVELPLDLAQVRETNTLEFSVNSGSFAGYRVDLASIVSER